MAMSYQTVMRAKGIKPLGDRKIRTKREKGHVEIVVGTDGRSRLHIFGEMK